MQLVDFAQKKAYLIDDSEFLKTIEQKLTKIYNINLFNGDKSYRFIQERDLPILKKYKHYACFNINKPTRYLFLTKYKGNQYCLYIAPNRLDKNNKQDKNKQSSDKTSYINKVYSVKHRFDNELYNDTLFEGESVQINRKNYIYLISDILLHKKQTCQDYSFSKKIDIIKDILTHKYRQDTGFDTNQILLKDFVEYKYLKSFVNEYLITVPYLQHISGIIFRPNIKSNRNLILILNKKDFHDIKINNINHNISSNNPTANNHNMNNNSDNMNIEIDYQTTSSADNISNILQNFSKKSLDIKFNNNNNVIHSNTNEQNSKFKSNKKKLKIDHKQFKYVNFQIKNTDMPDVYQLWLLNNENKLFKYGIASISTKNTSQSVKIWFNEHSEPFIVKCKYIKNFNKWEPVEISEKTEPDRINLICKSSK